MWPFCGVIKIRSSETFRLMPGNLFKLLLRYVTYIRLPDARAFPKRF